VAGPINNASSIVEPNSLVPGHDRWTVTTNGLLLLALSEKKHDIGNEPSSAATGLGDAAASNKLPMITTSAIVLFDMRPVPPRSCPGGESLGTGVGSQGSGIDPAPGVAASRNSATML
jgi:hypothetical protein